jgi:hypothetical protein
MAGDDLRVRLERSVGGQLGAPVRVTNLERSTEGFSQETFTFDVEAGRARHGYVAKRQPAAGVLDPYDLEPEFRYTRLRRSAAVSLTPWFAIRPCSSACST